MPAGATKPVTSGHPMLPAIPELNVAVVAVVAADTWRSMPKKNKPQKIVGSVCRGSFAFRVGEA